MTTDNIFGNDILNGGLNTSLVPELGQENILIDVTPSEMSLIDPLIQELSLTEPEIVIDGIDIDNNNNASSFDSIPVANIDPLTAANPKEFQVSEIDVNDTSFAPPQSQLTFQGGFGDYDGGNDVTLKIKDTDGSVIETFKLSGEGQATLYRDQEYQYLFFSGVDETTKVEIDSTSNIKFGNYLGDSLKIETPGSIEGRDIILSEPDETGLVLNSGIEGTATGNIYTNKYQITDLGGDFESIHPTDINNLGQVVGFIQTDGTSKGFFYDDESGFKVLDRYAHSRILGINDSEDVVGRFLNVKKYSTTIYDQRPFYTQGGGYIEPLAGKIPNSFDNLVDINNSGVVAGFGQIRKSYNGSRWNDSIIYDGDTRNRLFIDGQNIATAINDLGHVLGFSYETKQSFIYQDETVSWIGKSPEHISNWARDINNSGQIVGAVSEKVGTNSIHKVFIYSDGVMQIIDKNAGVAGIVKNNDHNQIVFSTAYTSSEGLKPYIYQNGELTNLNDLIDPEFRNAGWSLKSALEINNKGQIIGQASFRGENRGVILSPPPTPNYIKIGNISTFGDTVLLQGNEIILTGKAITTQGGEITFEGVTTTEKNLTIDTSVVEDEVITDGGDITFTNTLDAASAGGQSLRVKAGRGNLLFSDTVGGEATLRNINVLGADMVTATADITSDQLVKINATGNIVTQNITANNGKAVVSSEKKSISALDITSGNEDQDNIVLKAGDSVTVNNLSANELGVVRIVSGTILEQDETARVTGDITTGSITGQRIRVKSQGNFTATEDAFAHDGNVVLDAKLDLVAQNITAENGNVRLNSEEKSITAKDITTKNSEAKNIVIKAIEGIDVANLDAGELGLVRVTSGEIVENDTETLEDDTVVVGDISTARITGKTVRAVATGSFTATGDITAHGGKIEVAAINDISTKNVYSLAKSINLISTKGAVMVDGDLSLLETKEDLYVLQQLKEFVLDSGEDFLVGLLGQWGRNNGSEIVLQFTDPTFVKEFEQLSKNSNAVLLGRGVADIVSIIQGLAEISAGGTTSGLGVAAAPASGGTSLVLTAGGTLVVVHGAAVGNAASADLGVVIGQLSENLTKQFFEASVDTRINIAEKPTASTPLTKNGEPVRAGFRHVLEKHFDKPLSSSRSVFDISPDQLKTILQKKDLVISQVTAMPGGQYQRIVDTGQTVGRTALKFGGKPTSKIAVFTDVKGNLITTYPVP